MRLSFRQRAWLYFFCIGMGGFLACTGLYAAEIQVGSEKKEKKQGAFTQYEVDNVLRVALEPKDDRVYGSLNQALQDALKQVAQGDDVLVLVDSGVYREKLQPLILPEGSDASGRLILRASIPNMVTISGADLWPPSTWRYDREGKVYSRTWPYEKIVAREPVLGMPWVMRNSAMLYVDGVRMRQVYWPHGMPKGSFYLHENGQLYFVPPEGVRVVDWDKLAVIEVSNPERSTLLKTQGVNLVLQGIGFEYAPNVIEEDAAVDIAEADSVVVEHCTFSWNNATGLRIRKVDTVSLLRVECNHNGYSGIELVDIADCQIKGLTVALNFWRGIEAGVRTDYMPENAAWVMRDVALARIEHPVITENRNNGFFAEGCRDLSIQGGFIAANNGYGMYVDWIERLRLEDNRIVYNNGTGLDVVGKMYMEGCILYRNGLPEAFRPPAAQLSVPGAVGTYHLVDNILESDLAEVPVVRITRGEGAFPQWLSSGNLYYAPDEVAFSVYGYALDMREWRSLTQTDTRSLFADPRIIEPSESEDVPDPYLFTFKLDSPIFSREDWLEQKPILNADAIREQLLEQP